LELLPIDTLYHLRLLVLTIVAQVVLHVLVLVLFLERFYRCRKINLRFEKFVRGNLILRFKLQLVLGVYVHFLVHHLRKLLAIQTVEVCSVHLHVVLLVRLRHLIFIVIGDIPLIVLLLHYVVLEMVIAVLKGLSIDGGLCQQLGIFHVDIIDTSHATKVVHSSIHILHYSLVLLELLLIILFVTYFLGSCLKLCLD
jgi:hypothetical protein